MTGSATKQSSFVSEAKKLDCFASLAMTGKDLSDPAARCFSSAPNAEVSMFPWKEPKERVPLAVRQIRSFLRAHRPA